MTTGDGEAKEYREAPGGWVIAAEAYCGRPPSPSGADGCGRDVLVDRLLKRELGGVSRQSWAL